ncbi:sigma 54-interacting transcriptional regulator [Desulfovibrio sp. OttesenSCG-928-O18]|nr:sigma 54-interacting transcriptional regulator [Desulfovibrio sp. OttesenSCG-928-O18]
MSEPGATLPPKLHPLLQDHFLSILEANTDGILIIDKDTVAVYVNKSYSQITGIKFDELVGKELRKARPHALVSEVALTGRAMPGIYRKEGDVEYMAALSPIIAKNGELMGAVSICKDITEVQRLTKELRQSRSSANKLLTSLRHFYKARYKFDDIIGESETLKASVRQAKDVAQINADVLIYGESGTGKELFAQAIHNASMRAEGPFIAFNCASLSPGVMESELFGYADGAFTGAQRGGKAGIFTVAEGGTLLLDEISELSFEAQGKLLRVLQERAVRPVGHTVESPIDVRIIAATNKDLRALVDEKRFREDLFYRLNVLHLELPPLRERIGDTLFLAKFFARRIAGRYVPFSEEAAEAIVIYPWPGNIRELYNAIQYALHMSHGERISFEHLPRTASQPLPPKAREPISVAATPRTLAEIAAQAEREAIRNLLREHGNGVEAKKRIAKILEVSLTTLYNKIKAYGL